MTEEHFCKQPYAPCPVCLTEEEYEEAVYLKLGMGIYYEEEADKPSLFFEDEPDAQ